jgi:hypothetical protein
MNSSNCGRDLNARCPCKAWYPNMPATIAMHIGHQYLKMARRSGISESAFAFSLTEYSNRIVNSSGRRVASGRPTGSAAMLHHEF